MLLRLGCCKTFGVPIRIRSRFYASCSCSGRSYSCWNRPPPAGIAHLLPNACRHGTGIQSLRGVAGVNIDVAVYRGVFEREPIRVLHQRPYHWPSSPKPDGHLRILGHQVRSSACGGVEVCAAAEILSTYRHYVQCNTLESVREASMKHQVDLPDVFAVTAQRTFRP